VTSASACPLGSRHAEDVFGTCLSQEDSRHECLQRQQQSQPPKSVNVPRVDLDALLETRGLADTSWSVDIRREGQPVFQHNPDALLETASLAKVFLLLELGARMADGTTDPRDVLDRRFVDGVGDSGLWQHLATDRLPVADAARLVGAVSDNLATNVLIGLVGLEAVQARAARMAPGGSMLHDLVRDTRTAQTPATLSEGCASDWATIFHGLHRAAAGGDHVSVDVLEWLSAGADLSMVASAFELDPLSHASGVDGGVRLWNKTGTDAGVRADAGVVEVDGTAWAYAAICNWTGDDHGIRSEVLGTMRAIGSAIRDPR
jgi:beta-lactamase class A